MKKKNILFTGPPGCGKSTLIRKVVEKMEKPATGFYTGEIRDQGRRRGFAITTLDGKRGLLAHTEKKGQERVGKYWVHTDELDRLAVPSMEPSVPGQVVIVDEIGKMECLSPAFREALLRVLDSDHPVIGSIALRGNDFIERIKKRRDVEVVRVTPKNRDRLPDFLTAGHPSGQQDRT